MVEEWLAARGIDLTYETVRRWSVNIGLCIARHIRSTAPVDLQLLRADTYLERHGKPVAFYNDRASVFHVKKREETAGKGVTQLGHAMYELNIDTFCTINECRTVRRARDRYWTHPKKMRHRVLTGCMAKSTGNCHPLLLAPQIS
jgi:hypothetical protein